MRISRNDLLNHMIAFSQVDSCVVVGDPGVGKSYILSEMVRSLLDRKIPATMVRMDFLSQGTDAEIKETLGISETNWIEALKQVTVPENQKAVLIFDSYDSIRDENLKASLFNQIARAKRELTGWSIVVSVRTYDAARSQKLLDLFASEFSSNDIHCRRFIIPVLSEDELQTFLSNKEKLNVVYKEGTQKLKEILKIPFFLSLLNIITDKTDTSTEALKILKSEIELLQMYWAKVVYKTTPSVQTELFLKKLTSKMVEDRVLAVDKLDYLEGLSTEKILIGEMLLSENVLTEQGSHTVRIGYAHNILFDYAVSKLVLKDTTTELNAFIAVDPARPFFLRPSFIYFFARLWYTDQENFWSIYNDLSQSSDKVISLFNKLIPSTVVAREFDETTQLRFLNGAEPYEIVQITNVLQALRFLKATTNIAAQASLLLKLSSALQLAFVFDFTVILEGLINTPAVVDNTSVFAMCGQAARNLMQFLMASRSNPQVDQLSSYRGTALICKTYPTDIGTSRSCLEEVMDMLTQPGFNIAYFTSLTANMEDINNADPEFCAFIYSKIYAHEENSSDPETMHTSVLMSFNSSRHDQFGSCHYRLKSFFPKFLRANPELAIPIGLNITNQLINRRNGNGIVVPESISTPYEFSVNGIQAYYRVDLSFFWTTPYTEAEIGDHTKLIIDYFEELIHANQTDLLQSGVKKYVARAYSAYNWKTLLDLGSRHPSIFSELLFPLLLQPAILFWSDTIVAAGSFLESGAPFYSDEQLVQIERAILAIPGYLNGSELEKAEPVMLRLLNRLPFARLKEQASIDLTTGSDPVANDELVTFESTFGDYTTEMFLADRGVNVEDPEIEKLLSENKIIERFSNTFLNEVPDRETYAEPLQKAIALFAIIKENSKLPERLVQTILTTLAAVCNVVLRSELHLHSQFPLTSERYISIKEMILFCLSQYSESDTHAEGNYSPGSAYSMTPRMEAAFALPLLFKVTGSTELLPLIRQYSNDKNAVIRYGIVKSLHLLYNEQRELFWEIINKRLAEETDWFTKGSVIHKLDHLKIMTDEPDPFLAAYDLCKCDIFTISAGNNSFSDAFFVTALAFFRVTDDSRIKYILEECLDKNLPIATNLVLQAFNIIEPENWYRDYADPIDVDKSQRVLTVLTELLDRCEGILMSGQSAGTFNEDAKQAFAIMDSIIQRINFAMQVGGIIGRNGRPIDGDDQKNFYFFGKPLLERIIHISKQLDGGIMQGHSAHYFIEIMGVALRFDSRFSLATTYVITSMAARTNYTLDNFAISEIVGYTEKLLADHKNMLTEPEAFGQIMDLLNIYVQSGWPEALDLLWRLDEIFR